MHGDHILLWYLDKNIAFVSAFQMTVIISIVIKTMAHIYDIIVNPSVKV